MIYTVIQITDEPIVTSMLKIFYKRVEITLQPSLTVPTISLL